MQPAMETWKRNCKDEDLALFHDMRRRERKNFLILSAEDANASPISTPTRTGRELLAVDSEKNDFDWLLTPPGTPLFPSLDQDGPAVNLLQRRVLSRSASVSKTGRLSYVQEPSPKVLHCGNPSPKRPSTASSTSSTVSISRGRPLSPVFTNRSSPTLRSSSPCRPVTPTRRNSVVSSRSSSQSLTPTLQRNNTSPSTANRAGPLSGRSRGKSLSPRLDPWESSFQGFSAEPPPNLRTSFTDRTIQRGVTRIANNKSKTRSSSADLLDASGHSRWHLDSSDGSRNWSSSFSIDHNSSQNSRASVISFDDDVEMAESVLSGSTNSDGTMKFANTVIPKMEEPAVRKPVLPAKRQMKSSGSAADTMSILSGRKSCERQTTQRRNAQAMFRPLMSSAPLTSLYSSKTSGMRLLPPGPLTDSFTAQSGCLHVSNGGFLGEAATNVCGTNDNCQPVCGCQETIEEENSGDSISKEEAKGKCLGNCGPGYCEKRLVRPREQLNNADDGQKVSILIDTGNHIVPSAQKNEGSQIIGETTGALPGRCLMQTPQDSKTQPDDTSCVMDSEASNLSLTTPECHTKGRLTYQELNSRFDDHAASSMVTDISRKSDLKSRESKVKENCVEEQKLATLGKVSSLGIPNVLSSHVSQRVFSDLGSFRKHSPVKCLHTRSHDSLPLDDKNGSCISSVSDSHSVAMSAATARGGCQSVDLESTGGSVLGNIDLSSAATVDKAHQNTERMLHLLERDSSKTCVPVSPSSIGAMDGPSENDVNPEGFNISAHSSCHISANQLEMKPLELGFMSISSSEVSSRSSENSQAQVSATDKALQHDKVSRVSSCLVPPITMLVEDGLLCGFKEAGCGELSGGSFDASAAAGLMEEGSSTDDPTPKRAPGVLLSKRSVTLEEATDTILFCSSIVHELVYNAVSSALENEEQKIPKPSISKRDFVALFGFSGAENRPESRFRGLKTSSVARNRVQRPAAANGIVCETSSLVQKQRMIHRQTPVLTMRQSAMERIENAIVGNHEKVHTPNLVVLPKKKTKQRRRARCKCSCCTM